MLQLSPPHNSLTLMINRPLTYPAYNLCARRDDVTSNRQLQFYYPFVTVYEEQQTFRVVCSIY